MIEKSLTLNVVSVQAAQAVDPAQSQLLGRIEARDVALVTLASDAGDAQVTFHVKPEHCPPFGQRFEVVVREAPE